MSDTIDPTTLEDVRDRYATAASDAAGSCCSTDCCSDGAQDFGTTLYSAEDIAALPTKAAAASLGCGNPTAVAELREGERVLDLGSGGGIDVLLSATRVGPTGFVYGVDMTDEMLDLARKNQAEVGATNVAFLKGVIEDVPLEDNTVDVVISNCVINLSLDKPKVLAEMARSCGRVDASVSPISWPRTTCRRRIGASVVNGSDVLPAPFRSRSTSRACARQASWMSR